MVPLAKYKAVTGVGAVALVMVVYCNVLFGNINAVFTVHRSEISQVNLRHLCNSGGGQVVRKILNRILTRSQPGQERHGP